MRSIDTRQRSPPREQVLAGLADARRRRVLEALRDAEHPFDESALARRLVASGGSLPGPAASSPHLRRVRTTLRHVHLPALSSADLVDWDETAGTVALSDDPLLADPAFWRVVTADADLDDLLNCLSEPSRRAVLETLAEDGGHVDRPRLAAAIVARAPRGNQRDDAFERAMIALRHEHLPALEAAGLARVEGETVVATLDERFAIVDGLLDTPSHDGP